MPSEFTFDTDRNNSSGETAAQAIQALASFWGTKDEEAIVLNTLLLARELVRHAKFHPDGSCNILVKDQNKDEDLSVVIQGAVKPSSDITLDLDEMLPCGQSVGDALHDLSVMFRTAGLANTARVATVVAAKVSRHANTDEAGQRSVTVVSPYRPKGMRVPV